MNMLRLIPVFALIVTACEAPMPQNNVPIQTDMPDSIQVTWRENTPFAARLSDGQSCEADALGVTIFATPEEIDAARALMTPELRDQKRDACMVNRGYTITRRSFCTSQQMEGRQVYISSQTDALPPISQVLCLVPGNGPGQAGFVLV
jgi:hypothetical protein